VDVPDREETPGPEAERPVWFVGDLDDPWVASIADALPPGTRRVACPGDLGDTFTARGDGPAPGVVVLHRATLTGHDAERLARWRGGASAPQRVVLCFGPHVRHVDLERWAELAEVALPEATARDTIARHALSPAQAAARTRRPGVGPKARVVALSANASIRHTLVEACESAGYPCSAAREWSDAPATCPVVWEVPVFDADWPQALARRTRVGPVVALFGFPDRAVVAEARARGASACLELPFDLADLTNALDRLPFPRNEPAHDVPPPPAARRRAARAVADVGRDA